METYSVEAVLSAVDKNFTSTMKNADSSMENLDKSAQNTNTSILDIAKGAGVFKVVDTAIGVVKSSLDGAIGRFDTLNAYPKVMAQMGYSTDDVSTSLSILKKGVDGLPTSLQELTKSAQSFAILEKSATKGAQTATALNDAFLASGASSDDASRGVQQYSQMLATGAADLESWRTLQETMPYALTQVAKSFGLTGKSAERDLYSKLKAGEITMDQLNKRFVELDSGVNGFAQTARTASGGIGTSFTNMRNAVVNGLANTIETINNSLKAAGLKNGISTLFDEGKQAIIKGFAVFNQIVATAIPPIVKGFSNLVDILKPFLPIMPALITYFTVFATVVAIQNKISKISAAYKKWTEATKGATVAQKVLNTVMQANWIAIVIAAIVSLVAGFIYLWNTSEAFRNFWMGLWEGIKQAVDTAIKGIQGAWNSAVKWFTDTWNNIKSGANGLWDGTIQGAKDAVENIKNAWSSVKEWFTNLWNGTTSGLASAWVNVTTTLAPFIETIKNLFQPLIEFFTGLWSQVSTIFGAAWELIKTVVMGPVLLLIDLVTGNFTQLKDDAIMLWNTLCESIKTIVKTFVDIVVGYYTALHDTAINIWNAIVSTIQSLWQAFTSWIISTTKAIVDGIVNGWNSFKQGTIDLWNATIQWVKETWSAFKQWVVDSANDIVDGVKQGWENLKQGTIDLWNGMIDGLKGIWEGLKQDVNDLIDNVKSIFDTLKDINLFDIGKAIIDGFVKGLKQKWEDGMEFISGIGDWIREHKGPIRKDKKLLTPAGNAIMGGLNKGLFSGFKSVQSNVYSMGDRIGEVLGSDYSMDIGANVAAANRSIGGTVTHEVNMNNGKQPAYVTVRIGNQQFKAFVEDISSAQGQIVNQNSGF